MTIHNVPPICIIFQIKLNLERFCLPWNKHLTDATDTCYSLFTACIQFIPSYSPQFRIKPWVPFMNVHDIYNFTSLPSTKRNFSSLARSQRTFYFTAPVNNLLADSCRTRLRLAREDFSWRR